LWNGQPVYFFQPAELKTDTMKWFLGCSGFAYGDWTPVFYPSSLHSSERLSYYSSQYNTLEVNSSFYHIPRLGSLQKWVAETPDDFVFSVKIPQLITHYRKMIGTKESLSSFYNLVQNGLQHKLGPLLFQFPPSFSYTPDRLFAIVDQLDPGFINVVEFRHPGWWQSTVYDTLRAQNVVFCSISHPTLPDELVITSPIVYFRLHGVPELYRSPYTVAYLDRLVAGIQQQPGIETAYIYFNNTIAATAIDNLQYLQEKLVYG
jgi:uncharacterized protein YecE (DUF72 family)